MTRTTTLWSLLLLSAALALGSCTKDATEQATGPEPEAKAASKLVFSSENAVRGELLVCFGEEAVAGIESSVMQVTRSGGVATRSGIADFDAVLGSIGVKALQRLFPVDERNEERTRAAGLHRWYVVEFDAAADLDKAALDMARIAEVSKVEFNQQLMHVHEGRVIPLAETGAAPQTRAAVGFNDPHLGKQWHYINTGDKSIYSKIKAGADVNCDEAWKLCTGDPRVIVAVVDNCVQWDHPDLAANMWTNTAELNGSEGRDDDSNGYADDIHGFNFVDNTTLTISTKGDAPDHGTHVAGTVAAVNNNGTGVAGIAGGSGKNDGVKIMSCQIFHDKDGGDVAMAAKAIKYAADNGAAIIQCSYGYPCRLGNLRRGLFQRRQRREAGHRLLHRQTELRGHRGRTGHIRRRQRHDRHVELPRRLPRLHLRNGHVVRLHPGLLHQLRSRLQHCGSRRRRLPVVSGKHKYRSVRGVIDRQRRKVRLHAGHVDGLPPTFRAWRRSGSPMRCNSARPSPRTNSRRCC